MSAFPEAVLQNAYYGLPVKAGEIIGDERLPVAITAGVAAAEINLTAQIGNSHGCYIEFEVRNNGPVYVGMSKKLTSALTLTAGATSLGRRITSADAIAQNRFWVTKDMPFLEIISDVAATAVTYRRVDQNASRRKDAIATGH